MYNGGTYRSTRPQRWVYGQWLEFRDRVGEAQQRAGGRMVLMLNGELADDNKHSSFDLVELHPDFQMAVAIEALRPLLELVDRERGDLIYVTRGTEAHSGPDSWMDNKIGHDIGAVENVVHTGKDRLTLNSFDVLKLAIDGVRFNVAHHSPFGPGRLPHTRELYATRLAAHAFFSAVKAKEQIPDVYARGHYHVAGDSYDAYPTRALPLPSWQLPTSFVYRLGGERPEPVGGAILTCDRGKFEVARQTYHWPMERYEVI